ncbi:MAG: HNH endonuclease [Candidatus Thorarchaeota archaeon]
MEPNKRLRQLAAIGVFVINLLLVFFITFVFWTLTDSSGNLLDYLSTSWMFWNIPITLLTFALMWYNWGGQERLIYRVTERYWNQSKVLVTEQTDTLKEAITGEGDRTVSRLRYTSDKTKAELDRIKDEHSKHDRSTKEYLDRIEKFQMAAAGLAPRIPDDAKQQVFVRNGGKCVRCGRQEDLHFDRVIPVKEGGDDSLGNLQLLCKNCNPLKGRGLVKHGDIRVMKAVMKLEEYGFVIDAYGRRALIQVVHPIWGGMTRPFMSEEKIAIVLLASYPDQLEIEILCKLTKLSPSQIHTTTYQNKPKFEKIKNEFVKLSPDGLGWILTTIEDIDGYMDIQSGVSKTYGNSIP